MYIKRTFKKNLRIKKVLWQKKKCFHINPLTKLWLVFIGKRDSKKYIQNAGVFPFIDFENSKIIKYASKTSYILRKNTISLFAHFDKQMTLLEQQLYKVNELLNRLENKPYPEEIVITNNKNLSDNISEMLKIKRISEKDLEETAIKIRRFKEYQQNLEPIRKEMFNEMQNLLIIYRDLCFYSANIEGIYAQANMLIKQYISYINMRISLYKRGWIANTNQQNNMPQLIATDKFFLSPNKTIYIDDKIKKTIDNYEKIMKL